MSSVIFIVIIIRQRQRYLIITIDISYFCVTKVTDSKTASSSLACKRAAGSHRAMALQVTRSGAILSASSSGFHSSEDPKSHVYPSSSRTTPRAWTPRGPIQDPLGMRSSLIRKTWPSHRCRALRTSSETGVWLDLRRTPLTSSKTA